MPHQRQLIRAAIRQALEDAATVAADRVYATRVLPLRRNQLPAIAVYALEESVADDSATSAPRELARELALVVEAAIEHEDVAQLDNAMDDFAREIEVAMHADPYFGGVCSDSILDTTLLEVVEEGARKLGWLQLTYDVTYYTLAPEPPADEALDDFLRVEATHNLGNEVHEDDEAVDLFTVEEEP